MNLSGPAIILQMKLTMYQKKIEKQNEVHPKNIEIGNATIVLQQKLNTRKKHEEMMKITEYI
jgi:hypothetical protein